MGQHWRRVSRGLFFGAVLAACGTSLPPGPGNSENPNSGAGGVCANPGSAGCPCTTAGEAVACGKVVDKAGSYVTCSLGRSTCNGTTWGECMGNTLVIKSLSAASLSSDGLHLESMSQTCANPCDPNPNCTAILGSPSDVDASGLVVTDAGISLGSSDGGTAIACSDGGLVCQVSTCGGDASATTTVTGTVYDPAGNNPLYNIIVYIPNDPKGRLTPPSPGVQCSQCASNQSLALSLNAVTATYTDVNGNFTLKYAPNGANIPLVVQSGKWRREIVLTNVNPCTPNPVGTQGTCTNPNGVVGSLTFDPTACQLHLPRNQFDGYDYVAANGSYGRADLPQMAIVTGAADPLECILLKAGIDPAEVSSYEKDIPAPVAPKFPHHIHFFESDQAPGASLDAAYGTNQKGSVLWLDTGDPTPATPTPPHYDYYDLVLFPCEGNSLDKHRLYAGGIPEPAWGGPYANIVKYADMGGRIFTTHYGYTWLQYPGRQPGGGAAYTGAAPDNWGGMAGAADWTHATGSVNTSDPLTATINASFAKGAAFQQWLYNVGASTTLGQLTIHQGRQDLTVAPDHLYPGASQYWMTAPAASGGGTYDNHFTFNTPFNSPAAMQCGRVVYSDFHVSASAVVGGNNTCQASTDALGRTTYQGCGFTQECACGATACATVPQPGTCSEPCGTNADCADTTYACNGSVAGQCGPSTACTTSSCTPVACTQSNGGRWACPTGAGCDRQSHLCVCAQDSDCPTGALCVDNGQRGCGSGSCSGAQGAPTDGANCTLTATCAAAGCQGKAETCGAVAASCPIANHTCTNTNVCACASDADCFADGKCVNIAAVNNCAVDPTKCTGDPLSSYDGAYCQAATGMMSMKVTTCFDNTRCGGTGGVEACKVPGSCQTSGLVACTPATKQCAAQICTQNNNCASNLCVGGLCQCDVDTDCASGKCVAGGQDPNNACSGTGAGDVARCVPSAGACNTNSDCGSGDETCVISGTGTCGPTAGACNQNSDCPAFHQCNTGAHVCECAWDSDCPSGKCVNATSNCAFNGSFCSGTGTIDASQCKTGGAPASCTADSTCVQGGGSQIETCQGGTIARKCTDKTCNVNSDCPNTGQCSGNGGHCLCSADADCPSGKCVALGQGGCAKETGTGAADNGSCVPLSPNTCTLDSQCKGGNGNQVETCQAATFSCPLGGGHICGAGPSPSCLCAQDSDCVTGSLCVNFASNCPAGNTCTGSASGTHDAVGCTPDACVTNTDCGGSTTVQSEAATCLAPKSCQAAPCPKVGQCGGHASCNRNTNICVCQDNADCGGSALCVPSSANNNCTNWFGNPTGTCTGAGAADAASCQIAGMPRLCTSNATCGLAETCAAGASPSLGQCNKTCASSTQCTGHETCDPAALSCSQCLKNADCTSLAYPAVCNIPPTTNSPIGKCCDLKTPPDPALPFPPDPAISPYVGPSVDNTSCGLDSHDFPEECTQAPMSAQEKALEFMFFDITSCVQPDTSGPPDAGTPPPTLKPQTFPLIFTGSCGDAGGVVRWRELNFTATFPSPASGSNIAITAQTGPAGGDGGSLLPATPLSLVATDSVSGAVKVLLDTSGGYQDAGAGAGVFNMASPPLQSQSVLELFVTLTPTMDGTQSPTFATWNVVYDCPPSE